MPTTNVCPDSFQDLQDIADTLGKSRKVIVVTGAGISTNCGIPDFRSENGLYSLIQAQYDAALQNPPWEKTDDFDIDDRPKKKRRVTDRWYYELVPSTGAVVQNPNNQPREQKETRSPRSQSASRSTTSRSTPAPLDSSPLSSPRSTTPNPPSEDFKLVDSSPLLQQSQSSCAAPSYSSPRSLRSRTSTISSSIFTTDDTARENHSQSDSSAPSFLEKVDDPAIAIELEQDLNFQSSQASTISEDAPKDAPQFSQSSSTRTLPNLKGRDLFDSMIWSDPFTTSIFYMFISSLRDKVKNGVSTTTSTHRFLRVLRDGGRLVRNYTQNIDGLEEREGLATDLSLGPGNRARFHSKTQREPRPQSGLVGANSVHNGGVEVVYLHGSLAGLRCGICAKLCSWEQEDRHSATLAGSAPDCPSCTEYNAKRTHRGRRGLAVGRLRPDIVLYGEEHPNANLIAPLITHDLSLGPDFLLIMGTSLKVHGLKIMVKEFAKAVHVRGGKVVFVNRTKPPESTWGEFIDYWVEWDCDQWVLDLQHRKGNIWLPQGFQVEPNNRRESLGDPKTQTRKPSQASRPQAIRDDKLNGVYNTFKILDMLGQIKDSSGDTATRPMYWDKPLRTNVTTMNVRSSKHSRKSLPAPKASLKEGKTKKRKSCPSALEERKDSAIVADIWKGIRKLAPSLNPTPPASSRIALTELHINRLDPINHIFHRSFPANHFPNIGGYSLGKINLLTHPPFGADVPIHTPKRTPPPKISIERKSIAHSYGTRASARFSGTSAETDISVESTIIVDQTPRPCLPSWNSNEDTIVVTHTELDVQCIEDTIVVASTSFGASPRPRLPSWNSTGDTIIVANNSTSPPLPSRPSVEATIIISNSLSLSPVLSRPSTGDSTEDAIVVATPQEEDEAEDRKSTTSSTPPSPHTLPTSDPLTPVTQRIKRLGSIEAILSSPSDGDSGCSSAATSGTIYYDAVE